MTASHHSTFMDDCRQLVTQVSFIYKVDEFFHLFLVYLNKMRKLGEFKVLLTGVREEDESQIS